MWYENSYRRHLCDMHIDDWNDEFLSEFSPEEYFENLKTAKIQNAMLYFQSHVGLCYYPTKSGKMHNAFAGREDMMKKLVNLCRSNGISVTGYYSLIYNNWAYHEHPEWRMVARGSETVLGEEMQLSGEQSFASNKIDRYGMCCPNNPGYRKFVSEQIKEMCEYFEFDGMFFDMLFWPKTCYCPDCRKRFKEETGYEIPDTEDYNDPIWLLHLEKKRQWMGEFAQSVTDELKSYVPNASVEHNVAYAALPDAKKALAEEVLDACDYAGGDLYGGIYHQSFTCKFYKNATKNQPFEYMPSRCEPNLSKHTVTKSKDTLRSSVFLTSAHHGANLVIDAIDPVGTFDKRFYERLGDVFGETSRYEKYFSGDMIEDIGVYYSLRSKFNAHGEPYTNHNSCVASVVSMIKNHICSGVGGTFTDLNKYKILIAPCITGEDEKDYDRIIDYVKNGGNLYISGGDCKHFLKEFFGADVYDRTKECIVYISPKADGRAAKSFGWFNEKYPLHFDGTAPIVKNMKDSEVLATITLPYTHQSTVKFASIHSNPPGIKTDIPAMAMTNYGKGKVVWSGLPIESVRSTYQYSEVFLALLTDLFNFTPTLSSDAPEDVEITAFNQDDGIQISAVQLCEGAKARRVEPFEICVKVPAEPKKLLTLGDETEYPYEYDNGILKYQIDNLNMFDMKKIIF